MRALVEIIQSDFISLQLLTKLFNFLIRISMNNNNFLLMKLIGKNESLRDLMVTDCKLISNLISFFSNYKNEYIFEVSLICAQLIMFLSLVFDASAISQQTKVICISTLPVL